MRFWVALCVFLSSASASFGTPFLCVADEPASKPTPGIVSGPTVVAWRIDTDAATVFQAGSIAGVPIKGQMVTGDLRRMQGGGFEIKAWMLGGIDPPTRIHFLIKDRLSRTTSFTAVSAFLEEISNERTDTHVTIWRGLCRR